MIFSQVDICFGVRGTNYGVLRVLFYLSVLRVIANFVPAPGSKVPVNVQAGSTSICPILGAHAYRAESSTGGCLVIVSPEFDGRGGGPPS